MLHIHLSKKKNSEKNINQNLRKESKKWQEKIMKLL
jgi:hypothetical protein